MDPTPTNQSEGPNPNKPTWMNGCKRTKLIELTQTNKTKQSSLNKRTQTNETNYNQRTITYEPERTNLSDASFWFVWVSTFGLICIGCCVWIGTFVFLGT